MRDFVNHLLHDRHVGRRLDDLEVVVVAARQLRRAARDAALGEIAVLGSARLAAHRGGHFRRPLLAVGRQRRNAAVGRIDHQRRPPRRDGPAALPPELVVGGVDVGRRDSSERWSYCEAAAASSLRASSSVRNSRPANAAGRSSGVIVEFVQIPCRSGWPHGVRSGCPLCDRRRHRRSQRTVAASAAWQRRFHESRHADASRRSLASMPRRPIGTAYHTHRP